MQHHGQTMKRHSPTSPTVPLRQPPKPIIQQMNPNGTKPNRHDLKTDVQTKADHHHHHHEHMQLYRTALYRTAPYSVTKANLVSCAAL